MLMEAKECRWAQRGTGGAFQKSERKSSSTWLHLATMEGKKIRYWWVDSNGAETGLRTMRVLYLDTPRYK